MIANTLTVLPMLISVFWFFILTDDWYITRSQAKAYITLFAAACTMLYAGHCVYFNHYHDLLPLSDTLYAAAQLAVYPLYAIYINKVTHDTQRTLNSILLIPSAIIAVVTGTLYIMMKPDDTWLFITEYLYNNRLSNLNNLPLAQSVTHIAARIVFALQAILTLIYGAKRIRQHNKHIAENYADTFGRRVNHPQLTFLVFIIACVISLAALMIGRHTFLNHQLLLALPSLSFSALIFLLCHDAHRTSISHTTITETPNQPDKGNDIHEEENDSAPSSQTVENIPTPVHNNPTVSTIDTISTKIERLMNEECLYLKNDLKITDLAELLNTNRDYIQQAIKRMDKGTFSEYINRLRIEHACNLLRNKPDIPFFDLITACGYSSHASFYRNFKQFAGMSPSAYIESISTQDGSTT